jgi:hypothetical protein
MLQHAAKNVDLEATESAYLRSERSARRYGQAIHDSGAVEASQRNEGEQAGEGKIPSEAASVGEEM